MLKVALYHANAVKRILKLAKGYYGAKTHLVSVLQKEQVMNSYYYAYRDRRQKKRDFRQIVDHSYQRGSSYERTFILIIDAWFETWLRSKLTVKCLLTWLLTMQQLSQLLQMQLKQKLGK